MPALNFVILYVASPPVSAAFYADLLDRPPVESAPTFVMFALNGGMMFGLWSRAGVEPPATAPGGGELAITVADAATVRAIHADWSRKLAIAQAPTATDFGFTFVALDPDGHRVRVFAPSAPGDTK